MSTIARLFVLTLLSLFALSMPGGPPIASADGGAATYSWFAGGGFICGLDPAFCPDVATAANGDTISLSGTGEFSLHPKDVSGGGTFVHMNSAGAVLGEGTWTATKLLSFHSTGTPEGFPAGFTAGMAKLKIHLVGASGAEFDGILSIDCDLAELNPPGHLEGVTLNLQGAPLNFNKKASGATLFVLQ